MLKILYFTAEWCRPCHKFGPTLAREAGARDIELERIDVDNDTEGLALSYGIQSLPTVLLFVDGHLVERFGALGSSALQHKLDRAR